ncbi:MAG: DUF192 domain-containing protein [Bacteriovoracales bacterium]|nr:DUF192 domain-containing protein [Bacteriovoracales bacterium]
MKTFRVIVKKKNIILGEKVVEATSFIKRLCGLMFQSSFTKFDGMMIAPCNSIHTFFMKMPIHAIFLDKYNRIVKIYEYLVPWRITRIIFKAEKVLEISTQKNISNLKEGDLVEVICLS